ncbi:MAG: hypothetical protein JWR02_1322 [Mucilaginibacter sp.]|nr:hypothetical protein [Mucilaginibacter sp.]
MKLTPPLISLFIIIFLLPVLIIISCKKQPVNLSGITADATVIDGGNPAADGCGWEMKINSTDSLYSVPNLPIAFQTANLQVHITYHKLSTRYYCGMIANNPGPGMTEIQVDAITKH